MSAGTTAPTRAGATTPSRAGAPTPSRAGRPARPLPSAARLAWMRTVVELRMFVREPALMVFSFAYPVVMLVIFASVFGTEDVATLPDGTGISFARYFLPGMVATGIMLSSFQTVAISVAQLRDTGGLKRLHGSPLPPVAYFAGVTGQVLLSCLVQVAALCAVARWAFDVPMPGLWSQWATLAWVLVLGVAGGTVLGLAFSSVPRSGRSATGTVVPIVLVLQFVSGVFFGWDSLPGWMQNLAAAFPLKWMSQGLRSVFLPDQLAAMEQTGTWELPKVAAVLAAWALAGTILAVRTFRWTRRDDG